MRKSNVDISKLPKFTSLQEASEYLKQRGKLTFFGWETTDPPYAIHTFTRNNGVEYFVDIFQDGTIVVIQRGALGNKDF